MHLLEKYHHQLSKIISKAVLDDIVPMECTPVAKWFLGEAPQEYWEYRRDFPCVLPPAPVTWIEFEMPPIIRSDKRAIPRPARSVAALIMTLEIPEDNRDNFLRSDGIIELFAHFRRQSRIRDGIEISTDKRQESIQKAFDQELSARWVCVWQLMAEPLNHSVLVPFVSYAFYLDQNGQILDGLSVAYTMIMDVKRVPEEALNHVFSDTLPFLFALSLTHCRNVEVIEQELPPPIVKKRKEKGIPIYKFKILNIKPIGGKRIIDPNREKATIAQNGMMPMTFVRAHFKTFTEERPLFGRHRGTYFWHQFAKGSKEYGEITKEYRVKPEEKTL